MGEQQPRALLYAPLSIRTLSLLFVPILIADVVLRACVRNLI